MVDTLRPSTVELVKAQARGGRRSWPLDVALGPGLHAVLGRPEDGIAELAPLLGGISPLRSGRARVLGRDPARDPALRARMGVLLQEPLLPPAGSVEELCDRVERTRAPYAADPMGAALARAARGSVGAALGISAAAASGARAAGARPEAAGARAKPPNAKELLQDLGFGHWLKQRPELLSAAERRAVELALALSVPSPVALVLTEPFADIAPVDPGVLAHALGRAAEAGACVVLATGSVRDAVAFAQAIHMLESGRVVRSVPVEQAGELCPGIVAEFCVEVDPPRAFAERVSVEPAVSGIEWDERHEPTVVVVRGADPSEVAFAIARAAAGSGGQVRSIAQRSPSLDQVRAATAGLSQAAYQAAYAAYAAYARQATPWLGPEPRR